MERWNNGRMGIKDEKYFHFFKPTIPLFHHSNIPIRRVR
jgi:hypothetical protein